LSITEVKREVKLWTSTVCQCWTSSAAKLTFHSVINVHYMFTQINIQKKFL